MSVQKRISPRLLIHFSPQRSKQRFVTRLRYPAPTQIRLATSGTTACLAIDEIDLRAVVVQRVDGRFFLDVVEARPIRDLEHEGLSLIALGKLGLRPWVISGESLRREPRYSNALFVWLYNGHRVPPEQRKRILRVLTDKEPIELGQLEQTVRSGRDPFPSIMALVCADIVKLDLVSRPIGRGTIVRYRT